MKGKQWLSLALAAVLTLSLTACGDKGGGAGRPGKDPSEPTPPPTTQTPEPTPTPKPDPYEAVKTYWSQDQLTQAWGPNQAVEHIFFHPVVAYPELAFDGESNEEGIDDWMVTVGEYNKILQNLYEKDYILVPIESVWSEVTDETGTHMVRNTLMLPEGKKPLIISYDDTNYYYYMLHDGFTYKLILDEDGEIRSWGLDPQGNEVVSRDLDAITILDKFVEEHPDFSLNGAKGCLSLTGYEGILGYRTHTDRNVTDPAELVKWEENRQKEREAVKPIIARLKETGWTFGCHTWGHINLSNKTLSRVQDDMGRWMNEVGDLVGPTTILFYPHGARPDGDDWHTTGPIFRYLQEQGFRVFASVGINSFSYIKDDISAVICDRLHPDGKTLRWSRDRYLQFYDAWEIIDLETRPDMPYDRKP